MSDAVLEVRDLSVAYRGASGLLTAVDRVSFTLSRGEILGVVGESGSGKTTLIQGMLRILGPPAVITGGDVHLDGHAVLDLHGDALRQLRWKAASMVPQSALSAFNPVLSVGAQFVDTLLAHAPDMDRHTATEQTRQLLRLVDVDPVHVDSYPHQLSGGMRQRAALALALGLDPPLVVMDEPTTALDVVVERQILARILQLQAERSFAVVFVTHDIDLLRQFATRMAVMYAGRLVEIGDVAHFQRTAEGAGGTHPYTSALLAALPPALGEDREPTSLTGDAVRLAQPPSGCRFHPRCPLADTGCRKEAPPLSERSADHRVACWHR